MDNMLLRDKDTFPSEEVLESALKKAYTAYKKMMEEITGEEYGLTPQWNYYNDGKAWLCKVMHKKTVFWLSVWDGFFRTSFYFTEKHFDGIRALDIGQEIRNEFFSGKPVGKLYPMTLIINNTGQLKELYSIIEFKKSLK